MDPLQIPQNNPQNIQSNSPLNKREDSQPKYVSNKHSYNSSSREGDSRERSRNHYKPSYENPNSFNEDNEIDKNSFSNYENEISDKKKLYSYILLPKNYYNYITKNFACLCRDLRNSVRDINNIQYDYTLPHFQEYILKFATESTTTIKQAIKIISGYLFNELKDNFKKMTYWKVSFLIPDNVIGFIIGIDGKNINAIRDDSGTKIEVFQRNSSRKFRQIEIAGDPDSISCAAEKIYQITYKYINFNNQKILNRDREKNIEREYNRRPDQMSSYYYDKKSNRDNIEYNSREHREKDTKDTRESRGYKDERTREREEYRERQYYSNGSNKQEYRGRDEHSGSYEPHPRRDNQVDDRYKRSELISNSSSNKYKNDRKREWDRERDKNREYGRKNDSYTYRENYDTHSRGYNNDRNNRFKEYEIEQHYELENSNNNNNRSNHPAKHEYYTEDNHELQKYRYNKPEYSNSNNYPNKTLEKIDHQMNSSIPTRPYNKAREVEIIKPIPLPPEIPPVKNSLNLQPSHSPLSTPDNIDVKPQNDKNIDLMNKMAQISSSANFLPNSNKTSSLTIICPPDAISWLKDYKTNFWIELENWYHCSISKKSQNMSGKDMSFITFTGTPMENSLAIFHLQNYLIETSSNSNNH